jgi:hypothetical protein
MVRFVRWLVPPRVEIVPPAPRRPVLTLADIDRALDRLGPSAFVPRTAVARRALAAPAGFVGHRPATDARATWGPALVVVGRPTLVAPVRGAAPDTLVYVFHAGRGRR